jgi:hypothetical protein
MGFLPLFCSFRKFHYFKLYSMSTESRVEQKVDNYLSEPISHSCCPRPTAPGFFVQMANVIPDPRSHIESITPLSGQACLAALEHRLCRLKT